MIDTKALRQKILDMAIKGKLVPQDPNDEPASVLLERIRAEKQRLIKEGKIKKDKNDSVIFKGDDNRYYENNRYYEKVGSEVKDITDDLPFEIPNSWCWVKLPQIAQIELGKTLNKNTAEGEEVQYLCSINVQWEGINLDFVKKAKFTTNEQDKYKLCKNDLLICEGGEAGRSSVWNHDDIMYYQNALHRVRFIKGINAYFFKSVFDRYGNMGLISKYCVGVTIKHLTSSALNAMLFPLPPLSEQQRIVSRIEKMFDQITAIEQNQADIDTLYEEFRKRTLTLAIQGKLVPQDPNDEPASVLLERIRTEKKAKLGKKYVDSYIYKGDDNCYYEHIAGRAQGEPVEVPFDIPKGWSWSRIVTISDSYIGLTYKPTDIVNDGGYIVLRSSNIKDGKICLEDIVKVSSSIPDKLKVRKNDIIICARNGSKKLVGKSAIVDLDAPNLTFGAFMAICRTPLFAYVSKFLLTACFFEQLAAVSGTTTINQLTQASFNSFLVPIPPLAEQNRIVAKINEIFAMM